MIVVDANYFLRVFVRPLTPQDQAMLETAAALFRRVAEGEDDFTTTDAVIAEVVFALQRHYGLGRPDVARRIQPLLQLQGCRLPTKHLCLQALALWQASSKISFVDALCAVQAQGRGYPLATFDQELAKTSGAVIWSPPVVTTDESSR